MRLLLLLSTLPFAFLFAQGRTSIDLFSAAGYGQEYNSFAQSVGLSDGQENLLLFRAGAGATRVLGRHLRLRIGVQWAQYGFRFREESTITLPGSPPEEQFDQTIIQEIRYNYVESMLALRYQMHTRGRWSPFFELGTSAAISTGGSIQTAIDPEPLGFVGDASFGDEFFNPVSFVGRAGLGAECLISQKFAVYAMAVFQHHLTRINSNAESTVLPWQASVELGGRIFID